MVHPIIYSTLARNPADLSLEQTGDVGGGEIQASIIGLKSVLRSIEEISKSMGALNT